MIFRILRTILASAACIATHASAHETPVIEDEAQAKLAAEEVEGVWRSDGFGYVMQIHGEHVRFYHATPDFCIETDNESLALDDIFDVQRKTETGRLALSSSTEPFEFYFDRIDQLPASCLIDAGNGIPQTVDAVISLFSNHYVFFDERHLEWPKMAADFRAKAAGLNDDQAFYDVMVEMLAKTRDAHVELSAKIDGKTLRFDADPGLVRRQIALRAEHNGRSLAEERKIFHQEFWVEGIGQGVLHGNSSIAANDRIRYGMIDDKIGYLAVRSMGGYISDDKSDGETEAAVLDAILDRAIAQFDAARARAVILDISINSGGYSYLSRQLAGRFLESPAIAFGVFAGDAMDQTLQEEWVQPHGRSQFIGPVYLLTSSETVSAAESLTMAMRARPEMVHAGDRTRGALSTKLAKLLPNGWELMLSNQVVVDHRGEAWEGKGIPPDSPISVFPDRTIDDATLLRLDLSQTHQAAVQELHAAIRREIQTR